MKKLSLLLVILLLTSCSLFNKNKDDDISKAKQEMLWNENLLDTTGSENTDTLEESLTWSESEIEEVIENINEPTTSATPLTSWEALIEIEDLSNKDFYSGEFYINGIVLWVVDKIEVSFSNETSSYPEDLFKLRQFKVWDKKFKYMASSNFKTLDFWLNKYIFTAYSGENTYKVKVEINIPEKEVKNPANPQEARLTNEIANITDIKDLKVTESENVSEITCESDVLTNYLVENYWYTYWNSCRDIIKGKSIWFYVLRLEWEKYFYEKHYIDYDKKLHWILFLEEWTWVTKDSLKEKNYELKDVSYDSTLKADLFFKK